MKRKLLALLLVVVLSVLAVTACDGIKSTVRDIVGDEIYQQMAGTYHDVKDTIDGIFGVEEPTPEPDEHEHTYATEWSTNETHHWHAATCEHATLKADEAAHVYENGVCICGRTEPVAPHEHSYTSVVTPPTCTEAGYTTYTCTCGDSYTADEVAATGHSYTSVVTPPTCTEAGYTTYTCACGDSYTADEVAATGHSYTSVVTPPTCTEAGATTYTCACGDTYAEPIMPKHDYDANGKCSVCQGVIKTADPVVGQAYIFGMYQGNLDEVLYLKGGMDGYYMASTNNPAEAIFVYLEETEGGYYMYTFVNEAKTYINMVVSGTHVNGAYEAAASTVYTIDTEHNTVIATVNDAPYWFGTRNDKTFETIGPCATKYNGFYCEFYTAHHHDYVAGTPVPPTCTEAGYTLYTCACGDSYKVEGDPATDHTYSADWSKNDTHHWHAAICEHTDLKADEAEHVYENGVCICGAEDPTIPNGTITRPYPMSVPGTLSIEFAGGLDMVWYTFVATESTGLRVNLGDLDVDLGYKVGDSEVNYVEQAGVIEFTLTAGTTYVVGFGTHSGQAATINVTAAYFDADAKYQTVLGEGSNTLVFSPAEVEAGSATRKLVIINPANYMFASDLFVTELLDAQGVAVERNADLQYALVAGEYTVTFSMTLPMAIIADTEYPITVENKSAGGEDPEDPEDPIVGESDLVIGDNAVTITEGELTDGKTFAFIAENEGTYTFASNDLFVTIYDSTGMMIGRGQAYLAAGNYTIVVGAMAAGDYTLAISYQAPVTEPDGSYNNPFELDSLNTTITYVGNHDVYYVYTVTEDCAIIIAANGEYSISVGENSYYNKTAYAKAGDTVIINVYAYESVEYQYAISTGAYAEEGDFARPITLYFDEVVCAYPGGNDPEKFVWYMANIYEMGDYVITFNDRVNAKYVLNGGEAVAIVDATTKVSVSAGDVLYLAIQSYSLAEAEITFTTGLEYPVGHTNNHAEAVVGNNSFDLYAGAEEIWFDFVPTANGTITISGANATVMVYDDSIWWWAELTEGQVLNVTAGTTFEFYVLGWEDGTSAISFTISFEEKAETEITGDKVYTETVATPGDTTGWGTASSEYAFEVTESGKYLINVIGKDSSTWFQLYDAAGDTWTKITEYPYEITVAAGSEIRYRLRGYGTDAEGIEVTVEIYFVESVEIEDPEQPEAPDGDYITVETTDTNAWADIFTFAAGEAGTYTFTVPAGYGWYSKTAYDAWGAAEVDPYMNPEGGTVTLTLEAGDIYFFYYMTPTKGTHYISYTFAAGGEDPEDPEQPVINETNLVIGNNAIEQNDVIFAYTAAGEGTLKLTAGNAIMGNVSIVYSLNGGDSITLDLGTSAELALVAGDKVVITVTAEGYSSITAEWSGEQPEQPVVTDITGTYYGTDGWGNQSLTVVIDATTVTYTYSNSMQGDQTAAYAYAIVDGAVVLYLEDGSVAGAMYGYVTLTGGVPTAAGYNGTDYTLSTTAGGEQPEEPAPELVEGENVVSVTDGWNGTTVTFTATNDVTYVFTPGVNSVIGYGWSNYYPDESLVINLTAGETVTFQVMTEDYSVGDATVVITTCTHSGETTTTETEATCSVDGIKTVTCSDCGMVLFEEVTVEATGEHIFVDGACSYDCGTKKAAKIGDTYYDTLEEAVAAAADGDVIVLNDMIQLSARLDIKKNITIDLNDNAIYSSIEDSYGMIYVGVSGNLTIIDSSEWASGSITAYSTYAIGVYGTLTVNAGNVNSYGTYEDENGEDCEYAAIYNFYYDGTTYGTTVISNASVNVIWNCGILTVESGNINYLDNSGVAKINDGYILTIVAKDGSDAPALEGAGTLTIYGGKFECDVTEYVADHYAATADEFGIYTVAINHTYEAVVTDPTCTTAGFTTYTCSSCGDSYTEEGEAALGHADENGDFECDNSCGTVIEPAADSVLTIEQALALGKLFSKNAYTAGKYYVTGTINNVYNTTYGNMYIKDADGNELCIYGTYSADGMTGYSALTVKPVKGDVITVYGVIGYYSAVQMKDGWITEHTAHEHEADAATCTTPSVCTICGTTVEEALGHSFVDGSCSVCGISESAEQTYTHTFAAKTYTANETQTLNGVDWTLAGEGGYWGYDSTKGQQFGSGSKPYTSMTLTSADFTNVTNIVINTSGASNIVGTLTVTVGGVQIGDAITLTKTATDYTFTSDEPLDGPIVLTYSQTSSKAIYIYSISVTYSN